MKRLHYGRSFGSWLVVLTIVAVAGLVVAGCGSNDSSNDSSGGTTAVARTPTGTPIKIGFLDPSLGAGGVPQAGVGEKAALEAVNANGGVNGHPLDLVVCPVDGTPEKNISCANQFVEKQVVAVVDGFDFGVDAVRPILHSAGIPIVGAAAFTAQGEADTRLAFYFGPNQVTFSVGPLVTFKDQGLKKVAFTQIDVPASHGYFDGALIPAARRLGLEFSAVYYPPASPNFQTIASTLAATKPDIAGAAGLSDEGQCTALVKGLRDAGYENVIFGGFCTQFLKTLGPATVGKAYIYSSVWLPAMKQYAPAAVQEQLDQAEQALADVPDDRKGYYTYAVYGTILTLAEVLENVDGPVDSASVVQALKATKDMQSVLGGPISCDGSVRAGSSICTDGLLVAETQPDGSLKPLGGGFQAVPAQYMPPPPKG